MTSDPDIRNPLRDDAVQRVFSPQETARRLARQHVLGVGSRPEPAFDEFARRMAEETNAPLAMVNFLGADRQYFAGLHAPALVKGGPAAVALPNDPVRVMTPEQGWCPLVAARRKPRVFRDVFAYARFAGDPVVDLIGIRSYMGAPVIEEETGTVLGTVCVVDTEQHDWGGMEAVNYIKDQAVQLIALLSQRER